MPEYMGCVYVIGVEIQLNFRENSYTYLGYDRTDETNAFDSTTKSSSAAITCTYYALRVDSCNMSRVLIAKPYRT